jgi:hypothetical protein
MKCNCQSEKHDHKKGECGREAMEGARACKTCIEQDASPAAPKK